MVWRITALVLLVAPLVCANPFAAVAKAADEVAKLHAAGADLAPIAKRGDPWVVADELCARGNHDAAAAFAKAAAGADAAKLPAYVEAERGRKPNVATRDAVAASFRVKTEEEKLAALARAGPLGDDVFSVLVLMGRGGQLRRLRRFDEAENAFAEASERALRMGWLRQAEAAAYHSGDSAYERLEYRATLRHWQRVLDIARQRGNRSSVAAILGNIGMVHTSLAEYDKARAFQERALAMHTEMGRPGRVANTLANLGRLHLVTGENAKALSHYERALVLKREQGDRAGVGKVLMDIGAAYSAIGELRKALSYYERSLVELQAVGDRGGVARAFAGLGTVHEQLGQYSKALTYHQRGLKMKERLGDRAGVADTLGNIGITYTRLEEHEKAIAFQKRCLALQEKIGDRVGVANALSNLGINYESLGDFEKALDLQKRALAIQKSLGNRVGVADALGNIGTAYFGLGNPKEALAYHQRSLDVERELGRLDGAATSLGNIGKILEERGEHAKAAEYYEQALDLARDLGLRDVRFASLRLGLLLLDELDRPHDAIPLLEEAIAAIEDERNQARGFSDATRARFEKLLRFDRPYEAMARAHLKVGRPAEAFAYLERGRARNVLDLLEQSRLDPLQEAERRAKAQGDKERLATIQDVRTKLAAAERDVNAITHALTLRQTPKRTKALRAELKSARARRAEQLGRRALLVRALLPVGAPASVTAIRRALGRRERMLFYSVGPSASHVFLVTPLGKKLDVYELPLNRRELSKAIGDYRAAHTVRKARPDPDLARRVLDAVLPGAVRKELAGVERVYVIPHGPLHRLPLEALPGWAGSLPPVVHAHSASVMLWCKRRRDAQRAGAQQFAVVALGDPVFSKRLPRLPGTRREVESIAKALGEERVRALLGEGATKAALFEAAPRGRFLHVATHQFVDAKQRSAWLALTGGQLSLHDLFEHWRDRLAACELVVLSACDTVEGALQDDEGLYAMPLGFLYAGTPAVIGSLWRVDDASTAQLFADFYARLARGTPKLQAFTEARAELRKTRPEPYYWAPFVYLGDPR